MAVLTRFHILALAFALDCVLADSDRRKYLRFLACPEGQRQKAQEIQDSIAAIIADAQARPKLKPDEIRRSVEGFPAGHVMTEARRLARKMAKDKLQSRGIQIPWEVGPRDITKIANALLDTDLSIIETAKANLRKA